MIAEAATDRQLDDVDWALGWDEADQLHDELTALLQQRDCELQNVWRDKHGRWQACIVWTMTDSSSTQRGTPKFDDLPDLYLAAIETFKAEELNVNIFKANAQLFQHLDGAMFAKKPMTVTIKSVVVERIEDPSGVQQLPVVYFDELSRGAVISNRTNTKALAAEFGPETDNWTGRKVTLYAEFGRWFGRETWALRVKPAEVA